jgi:quercetin dioxygenase-like cupin family protein
LLRHSRSATVCVNTFQQGRNVAVLIHCLQVNEKPPKMEERDVQKSKAHNIVELIEYVADTVVFKTILRKSTGSISVVSVDRGEALAEKTIPFDTFVQIIDGKAEIVIDGISSFLNTGQSIIIPAHSPNKVKANERFKMISTIIKSGYE